MNCFALTRALAFLFSVLSGGGCCWMHLLRLVPAVVVVDGVVVVCGFFQLPYKPVPFWFVSW